jgi:hypothetical protein
MLHVQEAGKGVGLNRLRTRSFKFSSPPNVCAFFRDLNQDFGLIFFLNMGFALYSIQQLAKICLKTVYFKELKWTQT